MTKPNKTHPLRNIILLSFLSLFLASSAQANTKPEDQFLKSIHTAVDSKQEKNFWTLFNLQGVEEDMKAVIKKHIWKRLKTAKNLRLTLEPLPKDFRSEYVVNGIRHHANLKPLGFVKFTYQRDKSTGDSSTSIPYGKKADRFLFIGTVKEKLEGDFPPSKQIQVIIMGMGHPAVKFAGTMTYLQGNKPITEKIEDLGSGNLTRIVRGEAITHLEVHRTSAKGTLKVIIMEDEDTIFETKDNDTHQSVVFRN